MEAGSGTMWIRRVSGSPRESSHTASLVSAAALCGSPGASPGQGTESKPDSSPCLQLAKPADSQPPSPVLVWKQALTAGGIRPTASRASARWTGHGQGGRPAPAAPPCLSASSSLSSWQTCPQAALGPPCSGVPPQGAYGDRFLCLLLVWPNF